MTTVAIVEDSKIIRESLVEFVQRDTEFHCVCTCATAEDALKLIPKHKPQIVLMDIELPNLSGIECVARIKQMLPLIQIMMITVYEDTDRIFKALRAGASGYLLKRCTPEELISAMHEVRLGGAPMSREIARKVIYSFQEPLDILMEIKTLSPREREILELLADGFPNKKIADRLALTDGTVRWHLRHIYDKLHVRSRTEAALKFHSTKP
jgi:DNA-binding NarL/FixJ family response regulator